MAEHLSKTDSLSAPRQMRFPPQFIDDVQALVLSLIKDIVERYIKVMYIINLKKVNIPWELASLK